MDININTKGKDLFLKLASASLVIMMIVTTLLWWFVSPRLHEINEILANVSLMALRIFYLILILVTVLVFLTCSLEKNLLLSNFVVRIFLKVLYPSTMLLGNIVGISKGKIRTSYVQINNSFIKALDKKFKPEEVLILLPHCLQNTECDIRITVNIINCMQCGKCNIGKLNEVAQKYNVPIAIATGGTLARRIVLKYRPQFIIAVACQRDLVSGLQDVHPIPVYGVLNIRPEGPCINTMVDVETIDDALSKIIIPE